MLVPETVPTFALPLLLSPPSSYATITLLFVLSKANPTCLVVPASNSTSVPKEIDVPETVPTTAFPLLLSAPST